MKTGILNSLLYQNNKNTASARFPVYSVNPQNTPAPPKKHSIAKKTIDVMACALWIGVVGIGAYKTGVFRHKSSEYVMEKAIRIENKYDKLENLLKIDQNIKINDLLKGKNKIQKIGIKILYKLGDGFQNFKSRCGDELYNNIIAAAGTVIIMPIVIWTSPFGKSASTKSDKTCLTIRQPLSVLATLTLQGVFDKIFEQYMPRFIKKNILESKDVRDSSDKNGKIANEKFEKIKYNPSETKRIFEELTETDKLNGGLKGILSKENAKKLLKLNPLDTESVENYWRAFERELKAGNLDKNELPYIKSKFKIVADSVGYNKLVKQRPKIAMNILVVVTISRIFLGVIHGKAVNFFQKELKEQDKQSEVKK